MPTRRLLATSIAALLGLAGGPAFAQVDTSGSRWVGNLQFGNSLDPTGWEPFIVPDPQGMSWLHASQLRTPSGVAYPYPNLVPDRDAAGDAGEESGESAAGWRKYGVVQFGVLASGGDDDNALFRRYADWGNGPLLGFAAYSALDPKTGRFVELRGSRISQDDQYLRLRAGRLGSHRFEFFHRATSHTLGTTAFPLWDGVGSTRLSLPAGIATGSRPQEVQSALADRPRRVLATTRNTTGLSWEGATGGQWIGYGGVTRERREGQRAWGGPMYLTYFFGSPGPGGVGTPSRPGRFGGQYETVRPVDSATTDIQLGLRNRGGAGGWLIDLNLKGSFFRDHKDRLSFEVPFAVVPGTTSMINGGTWALEPDNDYYSVNLSASRPLRLWNGKLTMTGGWATMRQDDVLQAPLDPAFCPTGALISTSGIACADWNTTAALSRTSAEARIDTRLFDLRADFRPSQALGLYARARWYDEDNKTRYTMFNPLTGQYGYIAENGAVVLVIPEAGFSGLFKPGDPAYQSVATQVASIPFSYARTNLELGANYRVGRGTLGARYRFERRSPHHRERSRVDDQRLELDWNGRVFDAGMLRIGYEVEWRSGDHYEPNPYLDAFSPSMPGYVPPVVGNPAFTVAQMRKYDLGDLRAGKLRAILTLPLGDDATVSATLQGNRRDYSALIGRRSFDTFGADLAWDWAPSPQTTLSAYAGYQSSRLTQANVNDNEALAYSSPLQADTAFGGPFYPSANAWTAADEERNVNAGGFLHHAFSTRVRLQLGYDYSDSRGVNRYDYASLAAISTVYARILDEAAVGDRFPTNIYRVHDLTGKLDFALSQNVELRLFCRYQRGQFFDWHFAGFDTTDDLVVGNRLYSQLAPPSAWNAATVGAFVTLRF